MEALPASEHLFFAGEHTCALSYGLTQGAYVSGVRAAQRVLAGVGIGEWPLVPAVLELCDVVQSSPDIDWGIEDTFPGPGTGRGLSKRRWRSRMKAALRQNRSRGPSIFV